MDAGRLIETHVLLPQPARRETGVLRNQPAKSGWSAQLRLEYIFSDGRTYLGSSQITPADLPGKVKDLLTGRLDKTCYVKSDSRARYEKVVEVVDNLRAAGVDNSGLITELDAKAKAKQDAAGGVAQ